MRAIIFILLGVTACGPIQGSIDSNANRLKEGMSIQDVDAIIGASQETITEPDGVTCVSYLYDEVIAPRFVHARFLGNELVSASEGHRVTCSGI